jgi:cytochrome b6-f complex iron-sulfur subunit
MTNLTRRQFVTLTAASAAAACAGSPLFSNVAHAAGASRDPVDVGPAADFKPDTITDRWATSHGFFVVRRGDRLFAVSSTCTHKKVRLVAAGKAVGKGGGGGALKCPRHGSAFDADGHVTKSPARKPLPRFGVRLDDAGHLLVDPSKEFGEKDWDDESASVHLP